jgi:hypothetical protein
MAQASGNTGAELESGQRATTEMKLDISKIERTLFDLARERIVRDFNAPHNLQTPRDLIDTVISGFDQKPILQFLDQRLSDAKIYEAAIKAIGSNSRRWTTFLRAQPELKRRLFEYDPIAVSQAVQSGHLRVDDLLCLLPGQTQKADAVSILDWAVRLAKRNNYYDRTLCEFAKEILEKCPSLPSHQLLMCLAGTIGYGQIDRHPLKMPGMRYAIGSEFLRNLHWNGFKPDRHVQRLFDHWMLSNRIDVEKEVIDIHDLTVGTYPAMRSDSQFRRYLRYSLLGAAITPEGFSYTETDNRIWLLANYVEQKGKESDMNYFVI